MAKSFQLTAELHMAGPYGVPRVVNSIKQQLKNVTVDIKFRLANNLAGNVQNLTKDLRGLNRVVKTTANSTRDFTTSVNQLNRALTNLKGSTSHLRNVGNQVNKVNNYIRTMSTGIEGFGERSALAFKRFAAFAVAAAPIYGVARAISVGLKEALLFDKEMIKLSQVTGQTAQQLSGIENEITRLSTTFGVSSKELSQISVTLAQAGFAAKDVKIALETLAKTSLAPTFDSLENTTEALIAVTQQFDIKAQDLEKTFSSLNAIAARFAVESSDLTTVIQKSGGAFKAAGGNLNELLSLFTSVRQTTRESADTIATGFRTIFQRLQRKDTTDALAEIGIQLRTMDGEFVGPLEAIRRLNDGLAKVSTTSRLFNTVVEKISGLRQISKVIPLLTHFDVTLQSLNVAERNQNSLARDAAKAQDALLQKLSRVKEEFAELFRIVANDSAVRVLVAGFADLAVSLANVLETAKPLIPLLISIGSVKLAGGAPNFIRGVGKHFGFSKGGSVPGSGSGDTVPALLTPGEFVVRKSVVNKLGRGTFEHVNKYARGGFIKRKPDNGSFPRRNAKGRREIEEGLDEIINVNYKINEVQDRRPVVSSNTVETRESSLFTGVMWDKMYERMTKRVKLLSRESEILEHANKQLQLSYADENPDDEPKRTKHQQRRQKSKHFRNLERRDRFDLELKTAFEHLNKVASESTKSINLFANRMSEVFVNASQQALNLAKSLNAYRPSTQLLLPDHSYKGSTNFTRPNPYNIDPRMIDDMLDMIQFSNINPRELLGVMQPKPQLRLTDQRPKSLVRRNNLARRRPVFEGEYEDPEIPFNDSDIIDVDWEYNLDFLDDIDNIRVKNSKDRFSQFAGLGKKLGRGAKNVATSIGSKITIPNALLASLVGPQLIENSPLSDIQKKAANGALSGATTGGIFGQAAGPIGAVAGALVGGIVGYTASLSEAKKELEQIKLAETLKNLGEKIEAINKTGTFSNSSLSSVGDSFQSLIQRRHDISNRRVGFIEDTVNFSKDNGQIILDEIKTFDESLDSERVRIDELAENIASNVKNLDEFSKAGNNAGSALIRFVADIDKLPISDVQKKFSELIESKQNAKKVAEAFSQFELGQYRAQAALLRFTSALDNASRSVDLLESNTEFASSGRVKVVGFGNTLDNPKTANPDLFRRAIEVNSANFGSDASSLSGQAIQAQKVIKELPRLLLQAVKGPQNQDVFTGLRKSLEAEGIKGDILETIMSGAEGSSETLIDFFEEVTKNPDKVAEQLTASFTNLIDIFADADKRFKEQFNKLLDAVQESVNRTKEIDDSRVKLIDIQAEALHKFNEFTGKSTNVSQSEKLILGNQDFLTGNKGIGTNPRAIFSELQSSKSNIDKLRRDLEELSTNPRTVQNEQEFIKRTKELEKELTTSNRLRKALENLTNASSFAAAKLSKLDELGAARSQRFEIGQQLAFGSTQDRSSLTRNIALAFRAFQQGNLSNINDSDKQGVLDILQRLSQNDQFRGGVERVTKGELLRLNFPPDLADKFANALNPQEKDLQAEIIKSFEIAAKAQESIIQDLGSQQADFINAARSEFLGFVSALDKVLHSEEVRGVKSELRDISEKEQDITDKNISLAKLKELIGGSNQQALTRGRVLKDLLPQIESSKISQMIGSDGGSRILAKQILSFGADPASLQKEFKRNDLLKSSNIDLNEETINEIIRVANDLANNINPSGGNLQTAGSAQMELLAAAIRQVFAKDGITTNIQSNKQNIDTQLSSIGLDKQTIENILKDKSTFISLINQLEGLENADTLDSQLAKLGQRAESLTATLSDLEKNFADRTQQRGEIVPNTQASFASGGLIGGKGVGDTVPILASPGEFIVNRNAAKKNAALLHQINTRYASGGSIHYSTQSFKHENKPSFNTELLIKLKKLQNDNKLEDTNVRDKTNRSKPDYSKNKYPNNKLQNLSREDLLNQIYELQQELNKQRKPTHTNTPVRYFRTRRRFASGGRIFNPFADPDPNSNFITRLTKDIVGLTQDYHAGRIPAKIGGMIEDPLGKKKSREFELEANKRLQSIKITQDKARNQLTSARNDLNNFDNPLVSTSDFLAKHKNTPAYQEGVAIGNKNYQNFANKLKTNRIVQRLAERDKTKFRRFQAQRLIAAQQYTPKPQQDLVASKSPIRTTKIRSTTPIVATKPVIPPIQYATSAPITKIPTQNEKIQQRILQLKNEQDKRVAATRKRIDELKFAQTEGVERVSGINYANLSDQQRKDIVSGQLRLDERRTKIVQNRSTLLSGEEDNKLPIKPKIFSTQDKRRAIIAELRKQDKANRKTDFADRKKQARRNYEVAKIANTTGPFSQDLIDRFNPNTGTLTPLPQTNPNPQLHNPVQDIANTPNTNTNSTNNIASNTSTNNTTSVQTPQLDVVNQSMASLTNALGVFVTNGAKLAETLANFPKQIDLKATHDVNVTINGSQAFDTMEDSLKKLVVSQIDTAINKLINDRMPGSKVER